MSALLLLPLLLPQVDQASASGRVVDASGAPVAGAQVSASAGVGVAKGTTGADGRFLLRLPRPDFGDGLQLTVVLTSGVRNVFDFVVLASEPALAGDLGDLAVGEPGEVVVRVVRAETGEVVIKGQLWASGQFERTASRWGACYWVFEGLDEEDGETVVRLPPGAYQVGYINSPSTRWPVQGDTAVVVESGIEQFVELQVQYAF